MALPVKLQENQREVLPQHPRWLDQRIRPGITVASRACPALKPQLTTLRIFLRQGLALHRRTHLNTLLLWDAPGRFCPRPAARCKENDWTGRGMTTTVLSSMRVTTTVLSSIIAG